MPPKRHPYAVTAIERVLRRSCSATRPNPMSIIDQIGNSGAPETIGVGGMLSFSPSAPVVVPDAAPSAAPSNRPTCSALIFRLVGALKSKAVATMELAAGRTLKSHSSNGPEERIAPVVSVLPAGRAPRLRIVADAEPPLVSIAAADAIRTITAKLRIVITRNQLIPHPLRVITM